MPPSNGMNQTDLRRPNVDEVGLLLAELDAQGITFLTGSQDAVQRISLAERPCDDGLRGAARRGR